MQPVSGYEKFMGVDDDESGRWRFGAILFDEADGRLTVDGQSVEIDRSCAALLAALVRHADEPLGKDYLLETGWPGRAVHENSLAKAIGRLRQALGDDGWRIEAVYGHGYRFVQDTDKAPTPSTPSNPSPPWRRPRVLLALVAIVGICALLAAALFRAQPNESALKIGEAPDVMGRILWVDDHPENNAKERRFLERRRMAVYSVTSSEDALKLLAMYRYDAVVSDMGRHGNPLAGLELVQAMRARGDHTPFYLYTIMPSQAQRDLLAEHGGQGVAVTSDGLYSFLLPARDDR